MTTQTKAIEIASHDNPRVPYCADYGFWRDRLFLRGEGYYLRRRWAHANYREPDVPLTRSEAITWIAEVADYLYDPYTREQAEAMLARAEAELASCS